MRNLVLAVAFIALAAHVSCVQGTEILRVGFRVKPRRPRTVDKVRLVITAAIKPSTVCDRIHSLTVERDGSVITVMGEVGLPPDEACIALAPPPKMKVKANLTIGMLAAGRYEVRVRLRANVNTQKVKGKIRVRRKRG